MLGVNAMRDFAEGEEIRMSYGGRPLLHLIMYQGFLVSTAAEAYLSLLLVTSSDDKLAKIRVNVLNGLKIVPLHHASREIRANPGLVMRLRRQQAGSLSKEESDALDRELWLLPQSFAITSTGVPSHDLLSFLRVRAISNKAEAAEALKQSDQSRKRAELVLSEYRASQAAAAAAGGVVDDASETLQLPPLQIDVLSAENELGVLKELSTLALAAAESFEPASLRSEVLAALDPTDPVMQYRACLARIFRLCAAWSNEQLSRYVSVGAPATSASS